MKDGKKNETKTEEPEEEEAARERERERETRVSRVVRHVGGEPTAGRLEHGHDDEKTTAGSRRSPAGGQWTRVVSPTESSIVSS